VPETGMSRNEELSATLLATRHSERLLDSVNVNHPSGEVQFTGHIQVNVVRNVCRSAVKRGLVMPG